MKKLRLILILSISAIILITGGFVLYKARSISQQKSNQAQQTQNQSNSAQTTDQSNGESSTSTDDYKYAQNTNAKDISKAASNSQTSSSTNNITNISQQDIQNYSTMNKSTLIKTFGNNYKLQGSTLTFSNGLSFYGLSNNESKPTLIKLSNNVKIMGIKNGMTFAQIQSVLGKTKVTPTYINTKTNKVYKIQYSYGKDILKVISYSVDGKNSFIEILPT